MYGPPAGMDCRRPVFLQAARTKNNATVAGCHRAKTEGMSFNAHEGITFKQTPYALKL